VGRASDGRGKEGTNGDTISENLIALAKEVGCTEEEYLNVNPRMFKEAQDAADLSRK
jgi:hypothetical protein